MKKSFKSLGSIGFVPKGQISRKLIALILGLCIACSVITGAFVYVVYGQAVVTQTRYIEEGVASGAYSYTIWKESTTYYAKDRYGHIPSWGFTTNFSYLINSAISDTNSDGGGTIGLLAPANYTITNPIILMENVRLQGELDSKQAQPAVKIIAHAAFNDTNMIETEYVYANTTAHLTQSPEIFDLTIDGDSVATCGINFTNVDTARLTRVRVDNVEYGVWVDHYGGLYGDDRTANGIKVESCILGADETAFYANYSVQSHVRWSWFLVNTKIAIHWNGGSKIWLSHNEINVFTDCGIKLTDFSTGAAGRLGDITIDDNFFYTDQNAKYFNITCSNQNTIRILILDNNLSASSATRPDKTDLPEWSNGTAIPYSAFTGNFGFNSYSEERGVGTLLNGNTDLWINHTLVRNATGVIVISNRHQVAYLRVGSFTVDQFKITSSVAADADTLIYWYAWCYP